MIKDYCAGGVVFLQNRLVILRKRNGAWQLPKGHIDPGETPECAAVREVREETGLTACILEKLAETAYGFTEAGIEHYKTVQWFLMVATTNRIIPEEGLFIDSKLIDESEIDWLTFLNDRELADQGFRIYRQRKE